MHRKITFKQPPVHARRAAAAPAMIGSHLVGIVANLQQSFCSFCVRIVLRRRCQPLRFLTTIPALSVPTRAGILLAGRYRQPAGARTSHRPKRRPAISMINDARHPNDQKKVGSFVEGLGFRVARSPFLRSFEHGTAPFLRDHPHQHGSSQLTGKSSARRGAM